MEEVRLFLMNDSVDLARDGIQPPEGIEDMVAMTKDLIANGVPVKVCGTCQNRCGVLKGQPYYEGTQFSTMAECSAWVQSSESSLSNSSVRCKWSTEDRRSDMSDSTHCESIDSVILSARRLWTHPLPREDAVLFPLLLHRCNRPNLHRSEPLCDMERWAGMGFGRKHWLPHGRNSDARFEPQFRYRFGSRPEGFL